MEACNSFQHFSNSYTFKDEYYHYTTIIMVSHKCPIIGKQVAVMHFVWQVTIATIQPVKSTLNFSSSTYNSKTSSVTPMFNSFMHAWAMNEF